MKFYMILPILSIFTLSSCIDPMQIEPTPQNNIVIKDNITTDKPSPVTDVKDIDKDNKLALYKKKMGEIASTIKDDAIYKKISFDTKEKKDWFRELTYRLWDKQITEDEFMNEALDKYPTHRYEFAFIIKGFNKI